MAAVTVIEVGASCAPAPPAPAPTRRDYTPSEVLSPSQVKGFLNCSARWYFKYVRGLPDPPTAALALGIAVHEPIMRSLHAKKSTGEDLPTADLLDGFDQAWKAIRSETEFRSDESPAEFQACGQQLVAKYATEAMPRIRPAAVEQSADGMIGGVRVQSILDVFEEDGTIRDLKTAAHKPSGSAGSRPHMLQLATNVMLTPGASGLIQVDTLVKTKTPQLIPELHRLTDEDVRYAQTIYPLVQESMKAGYYLPNRAGMSCSHKLCPFWLACEREFGGEVKE